MTEKRGRLISLDIIRQITGTVCIFPASSDVFNQKGTAPLDHDGNWSLSPTDI
jgi:hypothetical protein